MTDYRPRILAVRFLKSLRYSYSCFVAVHFVIVEEELANECQQYIRR